MPSLTEIMKQKLKEQELKKEDFKVISKPEILLGEKIQKKVKKTIKREQEYKLTSYNLKTIFY